MFMLFMEKNLFNRIFTTNHLFVIQEPATKNQKPQEFWCVVNINNRSFF